MTVEGRKKTESRPEVIEAERNEWSQEGKEGQCSSRRKWVITRTRDLAEGK